MHTHVIMTPQTYREPYEYQAPEPTVCHLYRDRYGACHLDPRDRAHGSCHRHPLESKS